MHNFSTSSWERTVPSAQTTFFYLYPSTPYSKILDPPLTYSWPGLENPNF